jgi:hypothetical protein
MYILYSVVFGTEKKLSPLSVFLKISYRASKRDCPLWTRNPLLTKHELPVLYLWVYPEYHTLKRARLRKLIGWTICKTKPLRLMPGRGADKYIEAFAYKTRVSRKHRSSMTRCKFILGALNTGCVRQIKASGVHNDVQSTTNQTLHFGFCAALISKALALISNCKCVPWRAFDRT